MFMTLLRLWAQKVVRARISIGKYLGENTTEISAKYKIGIFFIPEMRYILSD